MLGLRLGLRLQIARVRNSMFKCKRKQRNLSVGFFLFRLNFRWFGLVRVGFGLGIELKLGFGFGFKVRVGVRTKVRVRVRVKFLRIGPSLTLVVLLSA